MPVFRIRPLLCSALFSAITVLPAGGQEMTFHFPPPASDSVLVDTVLDYVAQKSVCELPGAIVSSDYDQDCYHPIKDHLDYSDTVNYTAIYTFRRFCIPPQNTFIPFDTARFSHKDFLSVYDIKEETEKKKASWLTKALNQLVIWWSDAIRFIKKHLISPLRTLDLSWKIIVTIGAVFLIVGISFLTSRFAKRIYPQQNARLERFPFEARGEKIPSLQQAQALLENGDARGSVSELYGWMAHTADQLNLVKRYEWWTNRQFAKLINKRSSDMSALAVRIIGEYESIVFGHRPAESSSLRELIEKSSSVSKKVR